METRSSIGYRQECNLLQGTLLDKIRPPASEMTEDVRYQISEIEEVCLESLCPGQALHLCYLRNEVWDRKSNSAMVNHADSLIAYGYPQNR